MAGMQVEGVYRQHPQERVIFGQPCAEALVAEAERLGAARVFVTSTASLARMDDGPLQQIKAALGGRLAGSFERVAAHSPEEDVIAAANAAREAGADLIAAVGGGSVIDASKAMLLCLWERIDSVARLREQASRYSREGQDAPGGAIRMIAIPTTFSAAEFTPNAGITRKAERQKTAFSHSYFVPRTVILDAAATLSAPLSLLSTTGMKAMDHAVEAWCSPTANPMSDLYALSAAPLLARALPAIAADPEALGPRQEAQFGMWRAILAATCGAGTGACHGIGYALGAGYGVPHGATSSVMLPAVMRWNAPATEARQKRLAEALGDGAKPAADHVAELIERIGAPARLRDVGIDRAELPKIAERAVHYPPLKRNPRPIMSPADVAEILEMAW